MASGGAETEEAPPSHGDPLGLAQAERGEKYEQHMAQLQSQLDDVKARIDQAQKEADQLS